MQIQDILNIPDDELTEMSDAQLRSMLESLIPIVRTPNKTEQAKEITNMVDRLSKLLGV